MYEACFFEKFVRVAPTMNPAIFVHSIERCIHSQHIAILCIIPLNWDTLSWFFKTGSNFSKFSNLSPKGVGIQGNRKFFCQTSRLHTAFIHSYLFYHSFLKSFPMVYS